MPPTDGGRDNDSGCLGPLCCLVIGAALVLGMAYGLVWVVCTAAQNALH
jgi:hypothetical protein